MTREPSHSENRVLALAPTRRDAEVFRSIMAESKVECHLCQDISEICRGLEAGAAAAVLTEEGLGPEGFEFLSAALERQPAWSDFPLLILTQSGADSELALQALAGRWNITLLERPVRIPALLSAVRTALRARSRQYQIRAHLAESHQIATRLQEADRQKDEFLATLAHELRNPLAPIRNAVEIMRLEENPARAVAAREMIERQLARMVHLVDDLLDVSRISLGKMSLVRRPVAVATVVRDAVEVARPVIEEARHRFTIDLPPEPIILQADRTRLGEVISNLLINAAKYTERGGSIHLSVVTEGTDVVIRVRDTGIGIAPDMLDRIFHMFTQGHARRTSFDPGLGVGLTLARRLVEMHGGRLSASSAGPGQGSEFVVRLAVQPALATPAEEQPAPEPAVPPQRRIAVVDDNRDATDSMAAILELHGYQTRRGYNGREALDLVEAFRPHVMLLDIGMPDMSGYDVASAIRRLPGGGEITLIALTGWGQPEDRLRSDASGFDHHLVKPVNPVLLRRLLANWEPAQA